MTPTLDDRVNSLDCKGLCQECCGPIPFPKRIREKYPITIGEKPLPGNPFAVMFRVMRIGAYACPFLIEGRCTIYQERPAICRLWGAAEDLVCPHGCIPKLPPLTKEEGHRYLREHGEVTI